MTRASDVEGDELKKTFSREELHELVWSVPVERLAKQYGFSDRGFAKICERHLVPVPPRGYWAKLEAGHPMRRTALRSVQSASLQIVHITPRVRTPGSDYLAEILATAKSTAQETNLPEIAMHTEPAQPQPPGPLQAPALLPGEVHPDVSPFLRELRALRPDRDGYVNLRSVKVPPGAIDRVGRFINMLINALEIYGFAFEDDKKSFVGFAKEGYSVHFRIQAPRKRVRGGRETTRLWDNIHVGRLSFGIWTYSKGARAEWADTEKHQIEEAVPKMVDSILVGHVVGKAAQEQRAVEAARRAHIARRRELAALRAKRERGRHDFLESLTSMRREIADLRETMSLMPVPDDMPPEYRQMMGWTKSRLSDLEAQTTIERIQSSLVELQLFPVPDNLHDPEGDPPPKQNFWDD